MNIIRGLVKASLAAAISLMAQSALAATAQPCASGSPDASTRVGGVSACEYLVDLQSHSNYDDLFFGGGFVEIDRTDLIVSTGALTTTGGNKVGKYEISTAVLDMYEKLVLVFKAGSGSTTTPGELVAYKLTGLSGDYQTPFAKSTGNCDGTVFTGVNKGRPVDCTREISHIALLGIEKTDTPDIPGVPVPASLPLLLTGLGLTGWLTRRRA